LFGDYKSNFCVIPSCTLEIALIKVDLRLSCRQFDFIFQNHKMEHCLQE